MMMSENTEERSLADVKTDAAAVVDSSVEPLPEDFDLDAWLDGVRPTRRSVKLYPQAHLVARLEELADRIDNTPDDEPVDELVDEFERVKAQFKAGVWFTVEKRSVEWVRKFRKDITKRLGFATNKGGELAKDEDLTTVLLHQLVEQIVEPEGLTYNKLRQLANVNDGEVAKLIRAMTVANDHVAETAGVLDRDFSDRRSASDRG